jgi:hypothetical protein
MWLGLPARRTHDYTWHATTSLIATLEVASGKFHARCYRRYRHNEFIAFLKSLTHAMVKLALGLICDNYETHKHPAVKQWPAADPRIHLHFTPEPLPRGLNLIERWFVRLPSKPYAAAASTLCAEKAITRWLADWNETSVPLDQIGRRDQTQHPQCCTYLRDVTLVVT